MRACGISLYRTAVPLLVAALGAAAVLFALEERLLAAANRRASQLSYVIRGQSPRTIDVLNRKWLIGARRRLYHYQFYDPREQQLNGLSVLRFDAADPDRIATRVFALATYAGGRGDGHAWQVARAAGAATSIRRWRVTEFRSASTRRSLTLDAARDLRHRGAAALGR